MFTAEEARKAVIDYEENQRKAIETLSQTVMEQIEQNIRSCSSNGYHCSTFRARTSIFRRQEVEETITKWLTEAGYEIEVKNEIYLIRW